MQTRITEPGGHMINASEVVDVHRMKGCKSCCRHVCTSVGDESRASGQRSADGRSKCQSDLKCQKSTSVDRDWNLIGPARKKKKFSMLIKRWIFRKNFHDTSGCCGIGENRTEFMYAFRITRSPILYSAASESELNLFFFQVSQRIRL